MMTDKEKEARLAEIIFDINASGFMTLKDLHGRGFTWPTDSVEIEIESFTEIGPVAEPFTDRHGFPDPRTVIDAEFEEL